MSETQMARGEAERGDRPIVLTKEHFDEAVKVKWNTTTCLMAQCAKEYGLISNDGEIKMVSGCGEYVTPFGKDGIAWSLMRTFDTFYKYPGDESKPTLIALRDSLPITLGTLPVSNV